MALCTLGLRLIEIRAPQMGRLAFSNPQTDLEEALSKRPRLAVGPLECHRDDARHFLRIPQIPPSAKSLVESFIERLENEIRASPALREDNRQSVSSSAAQRNQDKNLHYRAEDQPWYTSRLPDTTEATAQKEIKVLRKRIDVVIITAREVELIAVMRLLRPLPKHRKIRLVYDGPETYYIGKFGEQGAVTTKCRMGAIGEGSATLAVAQAQRIWRPRAIIMVGIAFGQDPSKQKMADVLIASQIVPYESQRRGIKNISFRSPIPPSNATLLNRFENVQR